VLAAGSTEPNRSLLSHSNVPNPTLTTPGISGWVASLVQSPTIQRAKVGSSETKFAPARTRPDSHRNNQSSLRSRHDRVGLAWPAQVGSCLSPRQDGRARGAECRARPLGVLAVMSIPLEAGDVVLRAFAVVGASGAPVGTVDAGLVER
jgi:hypothetical protein